MSAATPYDNASLDSPSTKHSLQTNLLDGHSKRVWCVAPLGNEHVVSVSDDNSVIVWEFRSKKQERRWHHKGAMSVAVSHDRKYVVTGGRDGDLQLWDVVSGHNFSGPWKLHSDKVWSVTWSPDGTRIASCSEDDTFIIWNALPDSPTGKPFLGPILAEQNAVHTIAYCPMGTKLATGGRDSTIKIWDAGTGLLQVKLCDHAMSVSSVALIKGDILISGSIDHVARIWDISNSEQNVLKAVSRITTPDSAAVSSIAVSEHFVAIASYNHIHLRSLTNCEALTASFELPKGDEPNCIALSEDESTMVAGTERGKVYTWNIGGISSEFNEIVDIGHNGHSDPTHPEYDDNSYREDFFRNGDLLEYHFQSQSGPSLLVKKTRNILQQIVAPMRPSHETVVSTATGRRHFWMPRERSVAPNGTNETTHYRREPLVANIEKSLRGMAEGYSQAPTTISLTQPPSTETPRERAGFWATVRATVRRLLHFRRP